MAEVYVLWHAPRDIGNNQISTKSEFESISRKLPSKPVKVFEGTRQECEAEDKRILKELKERGYDVSFDNREKVSPEMLEKAKTDGVVQQKPNGKWGVISIQEGEWWLADYDSKEAADAALKAYHAQQKEFDEMTSECYIVKEWNGILGIETRESLIQWKFNPIAIGGSANRGMGKATIVAGPYRGKLEADKELKRMKSSRKQDFDSLLELKSQLFDAPSDVKLAFNDIVKYFGYESYEVAYYLDDKMYKVKVKSSSEEKAIDDVKRKSPDNAYGFKVLK